MLGGSGLGQAVGAGEGRSGQMYLGANSVQAPTSLARAGGVRLLFKGQGFSSK